MSEVIDYNVPLTTTYMKQMKLQSISSTKVCDSGVFACVRGDVRQEVRRSSVRDGVWEETRRSADPSAGTHLPHVVLRCY